MADWSQSGAWMFPGEDDAERIGPPPYASASTPAARCDCSSAGSGILLGALGAMVIVAARSASR